jgi:hypothetical protein
MITPRFQYTMQYQADQHIHLLNMKSWFCPCDDSGIPVHDSISGWPYHPSTKYSGRYRPSDCYAITVHDCIRLTNLHTNVILSHVSATMITPRFQYTMQYQADRHIHLLNMKSWFCPGDDSGIPVHDRISGWPQHPSIQYPARFRPFDCCKITVCDNPSG